MFSYTPINYFLNYSLEFETPNINLQLGERLMKSSSPNLEINNYVEENLKNETIFYTDGSKKKKPNKQELEFVVPVKFSRSIPFFSKHLFSHLKLLPSLKHYK